ncbi:MAG: flagellar biosynthesis anti-sigma factor FlgM [Planctomycetota bacterium]|jgi:anti-sigma28 factor (negative regulator of flagellin synthesis)
MVDAIGGIRPPGFDGPKDSRDRPPPTPAPGVQGSDKVELSQAGRLLARVRAMPDIREDVVEEIRQQIVRGTYVTEDKLGKALDNLVEDFLTGL